MFIKLLFRPLCVSETFHNKKWVQCHQWQWELELEGSLEKTGSGFSLTEEFQEGVEGLNLLRKEVKTEGKQCCLAATNMD